VVCRWSEKEAYRAQVGIDTELRLFDRELADECRLRSEELLDRRLPSRLREGRWLSGG
jgi:hypothetical protein